MKDIFENIPEEIEYKIIIYSNNIQTYNNVENITQDHIKYICKLLQNWFNTSLISIHNTNNILNIELKLNMQKSYKYEPINDFYGELEQDILNLFNIETDIYIKFIHKS